MSCEARIPATHTEVLSAWRPLWLARGTNTSVGNADVEDRRAIERTHSSGAVACRQEVRAVT